MAQSAEPFPPVFELSSLLPINGGNGSIGFVLNGIDPVDLSGHSVASAGDINNDGIDDIIIGADFASPNGLTKAGETYVIYGAIDLGIGGVGTGGVFELSAIDGINGFVFHGIDAGDESGWSVASAGDVNGDGIDDLIIGAFLADPNGVDRAGESYVVFGRDLSPCTPDLNGDGVLDLGDIQAFVGLFLAQDLAADLNSDGSIGNDDIGVFVGVFLAGC